MELAARLGGVVINADSMQVYRELRILTARPTTEDEAAVPHALYGVRPASAAGSVAWWRTAALAEMEAAHAAGRLPILCGGTGLYFASLIEGIAPIPEIEPAIRAQARAWLAAEGPAALHAALKAVDPETAAQLEPADGQRLARAWEVWFQTERGLAAWQSDPAEPAPWRFAALLLDPPREDLRLAIAGRFAGMLAQGALAEVRALLMLGLDPALPAMRAHGVPELTAHLNGEISLAEAAGRAERATGQYTKRQATWFRHHSLAQSGCTHIIHARHAGLTQLSESEHAQLFAFIESLG